MLHEIVKLYVPVVVGVPESTPLLAPSVRPAGNAPALTLQVSVAGKPVPVNVCE